MTFRPPLLITTAILLALPGPRPSEAGIIKKAAVGAAAVGVGVMAGSVYAKKIIKEKTLVAIVQQGTPAGRAALDDLRAQIDTHKIVGPKAYSDAAAEAVRKDPGLVDKERAVATGLGLAPVQKSQPSPNPAPTLGGAPAVYEDVYMVADEAGLDRMAFAAYVDQQKKAKGLPANYIFPLATLRQMAHDFPNG